MANTKFLDYNGLSKLVEKIKNTYVNKNEQYEANLKWGGKNLSGTCSPIDAIMIPEIVANRFAFGNPKGITVEYSNDGGNTWMNYNDDDDTYKLLISTGAAMLYVGNEGSDFPENDMLRITFDTSDYTGINCGAVLNKFIINVNTNGMTGCYCTIQKALQETPTVFSDVVVKATIDGNPGYNTINVPNINTYVEFKESEEPQYGRIRFIFGGTGGETINERLSINNIYAFGNNMESQPSYMAQTGHLYDYDYAQNATFPANVTATNFIGNASSASKLNTGTTGTSTKPVYFNNGVPATCTYELNKTVPSTAVFTDTKYTLSGDNTNKVTITDSNKSQQSITINDVQRATVATYANQYSYNGIDRDFVYDAVDGSNHYIRCKDAKILRANGTNLNKYEFIINSDGKGGCYIYDSANAKGTTWSPNGISFEKAPANSLVAANGTFITAITDAEIQNEIDKAITL